jgi:hypothetical protein
MSYFRDIFISMIGTTMSTDISQERVILGGGSVNTFISNRNWKYIIIVLLVAEKIKLMFSIVKYAYSDMINT